MHFKLKPIVCNTGFLFWWFLQGFLLFFFLSSLLVHRRNSSFSFTGLVLLIYWQLNSCVKCVPLKFFVFSKSMQRRGESFLGNLFSSQGQALFSLITYCYRCSVQWSVKAPMGEKQRFQWWLKKVWYSSSLSLVESADLIMTISTKLCYLANTQSHMSITLLILQKKQTWRETFNL